jgi:peptidyl-prolyl cis-trans isomerase SurA
MKKHFVTAAVIAAAITAFAAAKGDDPVLMTVNGHDVHVSEFNYLYNKNNSQQIQPQTLDEYVKMFVDYKLKVADAENAGIDTTQSFIDEYKQFESELARPYLRDLSVEDSLVNVAYSHFAENVEVSHIMFAPSPTPEGREKVIAKLDSIRTAILNGEISFADAAAKYSVDSGSKKRGGHMGYVVPTRYPWHFEEVAYNTPQGEISPVINSGVGYHIIKVEKRTPAEGDVLVKHILRLTKGMTPEQAAAQKVTIDSIYDAVKGGADFSDLARRLSQDPGSAKRGGALDWFGHGMMVNEFDSVAYALVDGEVSKPFATAYGYHIIEKINHRGIASLDDKREEILKAINNDERGNLPDQARLAQLKTQYNGKIIDKNFEKVCADIAKNPNGLDSAMRVNLRKDKTAIITVNGKTSSVADVMADVPGNRQLDAAAARQLLTNAANYAINGQVLDAARADLATNDADYRNLINEYRDGILLFEIAKRNVWDVPTTNPEGLENYFQANRDKYAWDAPKYKGYIIFTTSDSLLTEIKDYTATLPDMAQADLVKNLREKFGRDVKLERVIAAKGDNPISDYVAFGGEKPANEGPNVRWAYYTGYKGQIIDAPQEAIDVKGAVVTDYQNELEQQWLARLHKKYPVKINKKVLNSLK